MRRTHVSRFVVLSCLAAALTFVRVLEQLTTLVHAVWWTHLVNITWCITLVLHWSNQESIEQMLGECSTTKALNSHKSWMSYVLFLAALASNFIKPFLVADIALFGRSVHQSWVIPYLLDERRWIANEALDRFLFDKAWLVIMWNCVGMAMWHAPSTTVNLLGALFMTGAMGSLIDLMERCQREIRTLQQVRFI
jgi:hypothetical protein